MTERTSSMAFNKIYQFLWRITLILVLGVGLASCSSSSTEPELPTDPSAASIVQINVSTSRAAGDSGTGYEDGTEYENFIDERDGMRIYFFGADNKYICRLVTMARADNADGKGFSLQGVVPADLTKKADPNTGIVNFKVVVLANWTSYNDTDLIPGETTISELANKEWAKFGAMVVAGDNGSQNALGLLNPDKGRKMPFFGVHAYQATFAPGETTTLIEPISLLRAMAKIEVVFNNTSSTSSDFTSLNVINQLQSITLCGYNAQGYCIPDGVNSETDYDHNGNYAEDYVRGLHLVNNGSNDADAADKSILLQRTIKGSATQNETWVGYVPEYQNINSEDGTPLDSRAYLKLKFSYQIPDDECYRLEFAKYGSNGKPSSYFNIERNNLYRFRVKILENSFSVAIKGWGDCFDNDFDF